MNVNEPAPYYKIVKLTNELILAALNRQFPGVVLAHSEPHGLLTLETTREHVIDLLRFLKEDATTDMNFLTSLCGMHYPKNEGKELGVVYHLHSFQHNLRCRIKVFFPYSGSAHSNRNHLVALGQLDGAPRI